MHSLFRLVNFFVRPEICITNDSIIFDFKLKKLTCVVVIYLLGIFDHVDF